VLARGEREITEYQSEKQNDWVERNLRGIVAYAGIILTKGGGL